MDAVGRAARVRLLTLDFTLYFRYAIAASCVLAGEIYNEPSRVFLLAPRRARARHRGCKTMRRAVLYLVADIFVARGVGVGVFGVFVYYKYLSRCV